ncbi:MAG: AAA family ATPase [Rhodospirillales bacterium]
MDLRSRAAAQLTALLIAPGRDLYRQFTASLAGSRAFQILAELKTYPAQQVIDMRLRQLRPDVVLLDLETDLDRACELIRFITSLSPLVHVIGLHTRNDSEAIVRSLRLGASEFLHAPFDPAIQEQAVARIRRLLGPQAAEPKEAGKIVLFASAKPGSGASMLAAQTSLALRRLTNGKVLLADLDLMGGCLGFYLKLAPRGSLLDAVEQEGAATLPSLVASTGGVHLLASPAEPETDFVEPARLHLFLEQARQLYDWVILDAPSIFHRLSLLALSESDQAFLVSTSELASLHLARRAAALLAQLGFGQERYQVLINRVDKRDGLKESDLGKIVNCPVSESFPNDVISVDRAVAMGEPLDEGSELGRTVAAFAGRLAGVAAGEKRRASPVMNARPAFSET